LIHIELTSCRDVMAHTMGNKTKVLVVDDQLNIIDMVATVLRFHGFEVSTALTAGEALAKAAAERPDLVGARRAAARRGRVRGLPGVARRWSSAGGCVPHRAMPRATRLPA
jgi:DNA-binding NarL/FixJ family response regulator